MDRSDTIFEALQMPKDAVFSAVSRALRRLHADSAIVETESQFFDPMEFYASGQCAVSDVETSGTQWTKEWWQEEARLYDIPYNVWLNVEWQGNHLELVQVGVTGNHCRTVRSFVIANEKAVAEGFLAAVCKWCSEVRGEILVFSDGHWQKSSSLFRSVSNTSLDTLILPAGQKEEITADFTRFLGAESVYVRHGIPWKRGVIFLGPPGNGKTHMIKGLVNALGVPCLYIRSLSADYMSDQMCVSSVFERARATTPCILILEDIDSLVTANNRSFFLNEMDGFHANRGILAIATTNHPEKLDPALLDRPSRFDRKYLFTLPEVEERRRFIAAFNESLEPAVQLDSMAIDRVAGATDGFSYAYLKELFTSSMMKWIDTSGTTTMGEFMMSLVVTLREQMATSVEQMEGLAPDAGATDDDFTRTAQAFMRMRRQR